MTTTHRIGTTAVLILSLAAAGAPAASAQPIGGYTPNPANPTAVAVYSRQDKSMVPASSPSTPAGSPVKVSTAQPIVSVQAPAHGFDWGDAGIGAAGALALSMIGLGGALAISQRRTRRTGHTTA